MRLQSVTDEFKEQLHRSGGAPDGVREACLRFLVQGWISLNSLVVEDRRWDPQRIEEIALTFAELFNNEHNAVWQTESTDEQLAALRAADIIAAGLPASNDDEYRLYGHEFESSLFLREIDIAPRDSHYGSNFKIIRRSRNRLSQPAFSARSPISFSIREHIVCPSQHSNVRFSWSGFRRSPRSKKTDKRNGNDAAIQVYAGGYEVGRQWRPSILAGRDCAIFFSEEGGIDVDNRLSELQQHILTAVRQRARIVVLPELTISSHLRGQLAYWCAITDEVPDDLIILPGTYHINDPRRGKRNRAWLLRGDGVSVEHSQDKLLPYKTQKLIEDIVQDDPIIVNYIFDDFILNVLICIDFCDAETTTPLPSVVPASIILVPAMGDSATVRAHVRRCENLKAKGRPAVVIAQEALGNNPASWSWVFDGRQFIPETNDTEQLSNTFRLSTQATLTLS